MSPNSDNAMARFLFAILKQKNLKDIDWNLVASDPVLIEPITNGHAARMRYSRFRSTVTGQPASKRNRASEKSRSSKHKKEHQSKKDKLIKSESGVSLSSYAQFSPSSMASPYMGDTPDDFNTRFLTPCSDDMGQTLSIHPSALEEVEPQNTNLFANCLETDFMNHVDHDPDSSSLSAFEAACDFGSYGSGPGDLQALDNVSQTLVDSIHDWSGHHGY